MSGKFVPIDARPPPAATIGVLGWIRTRLFSSWINGAVTVLMIYALLQILPPIFQWMIFDATWGGGSSDACKHEQTGADGESYIVDAPGACWAFINTRIVQILFGLYFAKNPGEVWRPILMFAVFAGLMFPLFTPAFRWKPHLGVFLLFGFPFIAVALIHGEWLGLDVAHTNEWGGFLLTFFLAAGGIVLALPIGIVMALGRRSHLPIIRSLCVFYIELWRAAPLITILFMAS
ncbi:MAG: amino acid ABC transporter permease, partial [Gammaproteobacteria bacterium]